MSKRIKNKGISQHKILIATGLLLLFLVIATIIYLLGFLSNNIFSAAAPSKANGTGELKFDLEGFKELGIK